MAVDLAPGSSRHFAYRHAVFYPSGAELSIKPGETASLVTATGDSKRNVLTAIDAHIIGLTQLRNFVEKSREG